MSIKTILFDLDGTLLPMDQDIFIGDYFGRLANKFAPLGYEPEKFIGGVWTGLGAMVKNDGSRLNEDAFWKAFTSIFGEKARGDIGVFEEFYRVEFNEVQKVCGYEPKAAKAVRKLKEMGFRTVLATNPLFPAVATQQRIRWAGLALDDFELITTYENSSFCKPNLDYYREILDKIGCRAEDCLMVGNDVGEDMIAKKLGMEVFLITDCLINKVGEDISNYPNGSFDELMTYING